MAKAPGNCINTSSIVYIISKQHLNYHHNGTASPISSWSKCIKHVKAPGNCFNTRSIVIIFNKNKRALECISHFRLSLFLTIISTTLHVTMYKFLYKLNTSGQLIPVAKTPSNAGLPDPNKQEEPQVRKFFESANKAIESIKKPVH